MVRCRCQMNKPDSRCGTGMYLIGKVIGVYAVISVKGFLDLSDYTRQRVLGEHEHWLGEYRKHVESVGLSPVVL